jgi:hypothetical protein
MVHGQLETVGQQIPEEHRKLVVFVSGRGLASISTQIELSQPGPAN